jgi:chaperonin GroEL
MQDLAVLLGTQVIAGESELTKVSLTDLGRCKRAIIGRYRSVLIDAGGKKEAIDARAAEIRSQLDDPTLDQHERDALRRRLARLAGGVAILRVGGATEPELKERKDRVDDALHATKAAVEEGILPGGGTALVRAAARVRRRVIRNRSDSFKQGVEVILHACCAPLRQIVSNSGRNPELVLSKVERLRDNQGYDAATERYVDTLEVGIVDPLKVVRSALENAHSSASMLLSVGCTIVDDSPAE